MGHTVGDGYPLVFSKNSLGASTRSTLQETQAEQGRQDNKQDKYNERDAHPETSSEAQFESMP